MWWSCNEGQSNAASFGHTNSSRGETKPQGSLRSECSGDRAGCIPVPQLLQSPCPSVLEQVTKPSSGPDTFTIIKWMCYIDPTHLPFTEARQQPLHCTATCVDTVVEIIIPIYVNIEAFVSVSVGLEYILLKGVSDILLIQHIYDNKISLPRTDSLDEKRPLILSF